jgi:hypothetical protein
VAVFLFFADLLLLLLLLRLLLLLLLLFLFPSGGATCVTHG